MSCKRWVKVSRFFAMERLLDVTRNVYSEGHFSKAWKCLFMLKGEAGFINSRSKLIDSPVTDVRKAPHIPHPNCHPNTWHEKIQFPTPCVTSRYITAGAILQVYISCAWRLLYLLYWTSLKLLDTYAAKSCKNIPPLHISPNNSPARPPHVNNEHSLKGSIFVWFCSITV